MTWRHIRHHTLFKQENKQNKVPLSKWRTQLAKMATWWPHRCLWHHSSLSFGLKKLSSTWDTCWMSRKIKTKSLGLVWLKWLLPKGCPSQWNLSSWELRTGYCTKYSGTRGPEDCTPCSGAFKLFNALSTDPGPPSYEAWSRPRCRRHWGCCRLLLRISPPPLLPAMSTCHKFAAYSFIFQTSPPGHGLPHPEDGLCSPSF